MDGWVFISYSRTDRAYVDRLAAHLRERGIACWYDAALTAGTTFPAEIERQIDGCAAFIVVRTPEAMRSDWVGDEVSRALRLRKPVLPLLLIDSEPTINLERINAEDVRGGRMPGDAYLDRLRAALAQSAPATAAPGDDPPLVSRPDLGIYRTGRFAVPAALLAILLLCGYGIYSMFNPESDSPSQHVGEFDAGMDLIGMEFSPDGTTLAVTGWVEPDDYQGTDGHAVLQLWDVGDPAAPRRLSTTQFPDRDYPPSDLLSFTTDGRRFVADDAVWDVTEPGSPELVGTPDITAADIVFLDGDTAVTVGGDHFDLIDMAAADTPVVVSQSPPGVQALDLALSPDSKRVATAHSGELRVWDISTDGQTPLASRDLRRTTYGVAFGPTATSLIVVTSDGAELWDLTDLDRMRLISTFAPDAGGSCWDMSPDHATFVTCADGGGMRLWSIEGQTAASLGSVATGLVWRVVVGSTNLFATRGAANDGVVRLWPMPDASV